MNKLPSTRWRHVTVFVLLAYLTSWLWWSWFLPASGQPIGNLSGRSEDEAQMAQLLLAVGDFGPLLAALVMRLFISKEGLAGSLGWRRQWRFYLVAIVAPMLFYAVVAAINHLLGVGRFAWTRSDMPLWNYLSIELLIGGLIISFFIFGEEYGWRGYLLPALLPLGEGAATLLVGIIWAGWHLPLLLAGLNYPGQSVWLAIPLFTLVIVALSFPLTWFYRATAGSVVLVSLLHGFINSYGDGLTATALVAEGNPLVTGSAGLVTLILLLAMIGVVYGVMQRPWR